MGGTKIEAAALDSSSALHSRMRVTTPPDYSEMLTTIARLVSNIESEVGPVRSVGIGTPGTKSPGTGLMQNAYNTPLNGKPFQDDLEHVLKRSIRLANDAHCFTLSEATDGVGKGAAVLFGVIIGTGTGGGIVVNGGLVPGINGISGEWGHNPLPWPREDELPGPICTCGKRGCIETYLSGPGLCRDHRDVTEEKLLAEKIAERAAAGDHPCRSTLERYVDRMARAFASVINLLDPDVIVLGGGLSRIDDLYEQVPKQWGKYVFAKSVVTRLEPSRHGDSSGVRGAARLWTNSCHPA